MDISELLIFAIENHGSDLHVSSGEQPFIRIHGEMRKVELPNLDKESVHNMIYGILNDQQRKVYEENLELDFSFALGEYGRFRGNVFKQERGDAAVFQGHPEHDTELRGARPAEECCRTSPALKKGWSLLRAPRAVENRRPSQPWST